MGGTAAAVCWNWIIFLVPFHGAGPTVIERQMTKPCYEKLATVKTATMFDVMQRNKVRRPASFAAHR